jgi:hypothetical protein
MSKELKILVIAYYFPPYKRVGGRRWAKHCKYLYRSGIETYVLAGDFPDSTSSWDKDIKEYEQNITRIKLKKTRPPYFKNALPDNIASKIKWKLSLMNWNFKKNYLTGNYTDPSGNSTDEFFVAAKKIILEKNINTVILTVGPFHYSDIILSLKREFPHVKFVIDYRDLREYNLENLTDKQRLHENNEQKKVLGSVDLIVTVNNYITERLSLVNPSCQTFTMPHCVDDDFYKMNKRDEKSSSVRRFIYGGDLYGGLETEVHTFIDFMKNYESKAKEECMAELYLTYPAYADIFANYPSVKTAPILMLEDYQKRLSEADFILLFRPQWSLDSFSSKFFELLCLRKPILYFGSTGIVSEFLVNNKLGFHITKDNINGIAELLHKNTITKEIPDQNYDLYKHSFEFHTKLLVDKLNSL